MKRWKFHRTGPASPAFCPLTGFAPKCGRAQKRASRPKNWRPATCLRPPNFRIGHNPTRTQRCSLDGVQGSLTVKGEIHDTQLGLQPDDADRELQEQVRQRVKRWGRATCYLGLAVILSAGAWSFFFPGRPLHPLWQTWGRAFAVIFLCVSLPWLYAAGTTFNLWLYGANLRRIDRDFASGKSWKYRG